MERAESHIDTAVKSTETRFDSSSLWAPSSLPLRAEAPVLRGSCSSTAEAHLPGLSLTEDHAALIADTSEPPKTFKLGASSTDYARYADAQGTVPFGPALHGCADATKTTSSAYYSITLGVDREGANGHRQAINVNIGDGMKVNGKSVNDGMPHRGTFPIAPERNSEPYWKWVDATVSIKNGQGHLVINRLSSSETVPAKESEWDQVNVQYPLRRQSQTQHLNPDDYWYCNTPGQRFLLNNVSAEYRHASVGAVVVLR